MATIKDFIAWLTWDCGRFGKADDCVELVSVGYSAGGLQGACGHSLDVLEHCYDGVTEEHVKVRVYTEKNSFTIHALWRKADNGYLGCISQARRPRAGEDWHRGSDLADGTLSEETWRRILADIVSYELVRVHRNSFGEASTRSAPRSPRGVPESLIIARDGTARDAVTGEPVTKDKILGTQIR